MTSGDNTNAARCRRRLAGRDDLCDHELQYGSLRARSRVTTPSRLSATLVAALWAQGSSPGLQGPAKRASEFGGVRDTI